MNKSSEGGLVELAEACRSLGFNVLMMYPPADKMQFMADRCHQPGIKLYLSTVFTGGDGTWEQVMSPDEVARSAKPRSDTYQQGGEPLSLDEVFDHPLPCWNRLEVREYCRKRVADSARLPVDGLAFDLVGYRNYHCCYCSICERELEGYRRKHPQLTEKEASELFAEQAMVDFINGMAKAARDASPRIGLTIHVYPYFRPRPNYGNRLDLDYVGQTVSWFFQPHWPLGKVQRLTTEIVATEHQLYSTSDAAPFIGFYCDPPPKPALPEPCPGRAGRHPSQRRQGDTDGRIVSSGPYSRGSTCRRSSPRRDAAGLFWREASWRPFALK